MRVIAPPYALAKDEAPESAKDRQYREGEEDYLA